MSLLESDQRRGQKDREFKYRYRARRDACTATSRRLRPGGAAGQRRPSRGQQCSPRHVPTHAQTAAETRDFSCTALLSTGDTGAPLEETDSNFRSRLVEGPSRNCAIRPLGVARRAATQQGLSIWTAMLPVRGKSSENVGGCDFYWIAAVTHSRRAREPRFAQSPLCLPNETDSLTSRTAPIDSDAKSLQAAPFEPDRLSPAAEILDNARRGCRRG